MFTLFMSRRPHIILNSDVFHAKVIVFVLDISTGNGILLFTKCIVRLLQLRSNIAIV